MLRLPNSDLATDLDRTLKFDPKKVRPATGVMRIFPTRDDRNIFMHTSKNPSSSLAQLKYRMIDRSTKRLMGDIDKSKFK